MRRPRRNANALGQRARRHYWLAPRSDDAVGAEVLGQGAGVIAAVASRLLPLRSRMLDWGRAVASSPKPDAYLQTLRPPGFRR